MTTLQSNFNDDDLNYSASPAQPSSAMKFESPSEKIQICQKIQSSINLIILSKTFTLLQPYNQHQIQQLSTLKGFVIDLKNMIIREQTDEELSKMRNRDCKIQNQPKTNHTQSIRSNKGRSPFDDIISLEENARQTHRFQVEVKGFDLSSPKFESPIQKENKAGIIENTKNEHIKQNYTVNSISHISKNSQTKLVLSPETQSLHNLHSKMNEAISDGKSKGISKEIKIQQSEEEEDQQLDDLVCYEYQERPLQKKNSHYAQLTHEEKVAKYFADSRKIFSPIQERAIQEESSLQKCLERDRRCIQQVNQNKNFLMAKLNILKINNRNPFSCNNRRIMKKKYNYLPDQDRHS